MGRRPLETPKTNKSDTETLQATSRKPQSGPANVPMPHEGGLIWGTGGLLWASPVPLVGFEGVPSGICGVSCGYLGSSNMSYGSSHPTKWIRFLVVF